MGILDDAIREHLELKRRHGASEEDLRQQEVEALGSTPGEAADEDSGEPAAAEAVPEPVDGNGSVAAAEESEAEPPPEPAEPVVEEPEPVLQEPEPAVEEPAVEEEPPRRASDTPTEGFDALAEPEEEEPEEAADVLEDTPDFLQETPEHDRLWFEQKPPRDFDFD